MELEAFKESEKSRIRKSVRGVQSEVGIDKKSEGEKDKDEIKKLESSLQQVIAQIGQMRPMNVGVEGDKRIEGDGGQRSAGWGYGRRDNAGMGGRPNESGYGMNRGPFDINKIKCYACGKMGNYARECPGVTKKEEKDVPEATPLNE
jgi:hypothetical protein